MTSDAQNPAGAARALIPLLGLALLLMLGLALKERFTHPQLIMATPEVMLQSGANAPEDDKIGALMRRVGERPDDMDALVALIERLAETQNWEAAETFAQRAVALDVRNPRPLFLLGVAMHNLGRHQDAATVLERVVSLRDDAAVRYSLGVLYHYFLGKPDRALEHLRAGLRDAAAAPELAQAIRTELEKVAASGEAAGSPPAERQRPEQERRGPGAAGR